MLLLHLLPVLLLLHLLNVGLLLLLLLLLIMVMLLLLQLNLRVFVVLVIVIMIAAYRTAGKLRLLTKIVGVFDKLLLVAVLLLFAVGVGGVVVRVRQNLGGNLLKLIFVDGSFFFFVFFLFIIAPWIDKKVLDVIGESDFATVWTLNCEFMLD